MQNHFIEFLLYEKTREKGYACDDIYCYTKDKFAYELENFIYFVETACTAIC